MKCKILESAMKIKRLSGFVDYVKNRKNLKNIGIVFGATLLLLMVQIVKNDGFKGKYIEDKDGNLVGISRESLEEGTSVPVEYKAYGDGEAAEKRILLYLNGKEGSTQSEKGEQSPEELLQEQIDAEIREIEGSDSRVVTLPKNLQDGSRILWAKPEKKVNYALLLIFPAIVLLMYKSYRDKAIDREKIRKNGIKRSLPMFNNQLLLLLESGLIFNDAFGRIALGYKGRNPDENRPLEASVVEIYEKSTDTNSSLISLLNQYSKSIEVKEFSRLVTIIADNQYKGVDLREKLEVESGILWEQRKKTAEEKGKAAETKLTFPLAVLLLVLIIITAAPAILQI